MNPPTRDAPLIRRLLPPLQALSLLCLLFAAGGVLAVAGPWSGASNWVAVLYTAAIPAVAILWVVRARLTSLRSRAVVSAVVAVVLLPVALTGAVGFTIPVLLVAVALMVVDIGRNAGLLTALVAAVAGTLLHLTSGNNVLIGLSNAIPVAVLLGFGVALGSALRAYENAHAADRHTIAERDRALVRLEEAIARLRRTTEVEKELLLADERARSARDLHDGLGHRLTLISMSLEFAQRARASDPDAAWEEVGRADGTAREALAQMRTWVRALSPVRDADATGAAAFEAIAESFRGTGLEVLVDPGPHELELTADASLLFYRAVQEGLTNALRHGRSERVRITLGAEPGQVALHLVSDLDPAARARTPTGQARAGFGLRGLTDRASTMGGHVRAGRHGEHFELTVRLPADQALEAPLRAAAPPSTGAARSATGVPSLPSPGERATQRPAGEDGR